MKCTIILLLAACLQVSANGHAQTISVKFRELSFEKALKEVARKSGYQVFYQQTQIKQAKPVSISKENTDVREVLNELFKEQPLKYEITNKTIVVSVKEGKKEVDFFTPGLNSGLLLLTLIDIKGSVKDESGKPVVGASVQVKGTNKGTTTNNEGEFLLTGVDDKATLIISAVNIETREVGVNGRSEISMVVKLKISALEDVEVTVNTGYQSLPAERATGSFTTIDRKLLERNPSSTILDRLNGITNGMLQNSRATSGGSKIGISIRGTSTLSPLVSKDPLIVIDNFPYEGDIDNINPNDIASVTVLKDAAAASIWGARSGNGVIVIATKRGNFNRKLAVEFNMNIGIQGKPDFSYDQRYIPATGYLEIERYLFDRGFYNSTLNNRTTFPGVTPGIEFLFRHRAGQISTATLNASLDSMRNKDLRSQMADNLYRSITRQQYAMNVSGGSETLSYYFGLGYDHEDASLKRNNSQRVSVTSINTFRPLRQLEITSTLIYANSKINTPNNMGWGNTAGASLNRFYPYASLIDENGNATTINNGNRQSFLDSVEILGLLDWRYRPMQELAIAKNQSRLNNLTLGLSAKYNFAKFLNIDVQYRNERQVIDGEQNQPEESYAVRSLINRYTQYNTTTRLITYPFPRGGILRYANSTIINNNLRAQLNFTHNWKEHRVNGIAGAEIREATLTAFNRVVYGYFDKYGSSTDVIDYVTRFRLQGGGNASITPPPGSTTGTTQRFISYFANASYTYRNKFTFTLSGRKDGANLFGVRANDRVTPLWSVGGSWDISKESFYKIAWLPYLKLRTTYGYNGNVYSGPAYLTASMGSISSLTNLYNGDINNAPNPDLRWEKVRNINFGIEFSTKNNIIQGSMEYYLKQGVDLVQSTELPPSTGFAAYQANSASTKTKGLEIMLNTRNHTGIFQWTTNFIFNYNVDRVKRYDATILARNLAAADLGALYPGNYLNGMYSYQWNGIDPVNGDPIGILNKQPSKDYGGIINNRQVEDLVYHGSSRPLVFGALRNNLSWNGFTVSANITFKLDYYFRKPSLNLNYQQLLAGGTHTDYFRRWVQAGDELKSDVPSLVYTTNANRTTFYRNSSIHIERADHIRLNDIAISYDASTLLKNSRTISSLSFYSYLSNIGLLWRANDAGIDPDFTADYQLRTSMTVTLGVRAKF